MGASVLHEDAIYPARVADIPIKIRNTNCVSDVAVLLCRAIPHLYLKLYYSSPKHTFIHWLHELHFLLSHHDE